MVINIVGEGIARLVPPSPNAMDGAILVMRRSGGGRFRALAGQRLLEWWRGSRQEAVMSGEILLATRHLFSRDPENIVHELWRQAEEAEEGSALALILYPEGWMQPERLTFSKNYSEVSISLYVEGGVEQVSSAQAVREVATAQLLMRRAAVFALEIQRLKRERGLSSEDEAVLAYSHWAHGYNWPGEDIPPQEKSRIETWADDHLWFYCRGQEVLQALQDQDFLSKAIQAPPGVSAWTMKPPGELGIQWPPAPQKDSLFSQTSLVEWLSVPPSEIVRTLAEAAQRKMCVTLVLSPVAGLDFHQDGSVIGFYDMGGYWKKDNWRENGEGIADFLAEEKLALRRAVVRAAAFQHLVEGRGLKKAAHLIALAEYGFSWLYDVPEAGRHLIREAADQHLAILQEGMYVLEAWKQASSAASRPT
jgi:hypothetical protein